MHLRLTVYLKSQAATETSTALLTSDQSHSSSTKQDPVSRLESKLESRLESALAARVVLLLVDKAAGKAELASLLGQKTVSGALHRQIRLLLDRHLIEMTLPDKPNSRFQQYRLTKEGFAVVTETKKALG